MPSTVVQLGLAAVLAAGLLATAYDRRALAVVLVVGVVPEVDALAGPWLPGAHRALLHTLLIPIAAGAWLWWDTCYRDRSWLRDRWGTRGVRIAWVALFTHAFAHVLLDYAHLEGINAFYPVYDRFFRLEGELFLSTTDGLLQTFVDIGTETDVGAGGTTANTHVANPIEPTADPTPEGPVDRRFPIAEQGWELFFAVTGLFVLVARRFQDRRDE
ncbi:metal-dependent hydrolase [Halosolutus gelatinilyticus]|uniref:metal-dependent hydrolase n=1 Tax=Halosolutus gelatinilyticus TaxID=2931975 RepID=UPI001FF123F0|nr:metal-dependent hydrolase [Halosolutus gelatinilyticus]